MAETYEAVINNAYPKAKTMGYQYGFMLLRVISVSYFEEGDPLILLYEQLKGGSATQEQVDSCLDFWTYLVNLSLVSGGGQYNPYPIIANSDTADYYSLALPLLDTDMKAALEDARSNGKFLAFSKYLIESYGSALKGFFHKLNPVYMRDISFTVVEFYMNGDGIGFTAHHSNGTSSTFFRSSTDTQSANVDFADDIGFFMGDISELRREWLVNGEPMYKAKPYGKYNLDGEWKPIVYYNGDSSIPQQAALDFSEDEQVQGIFFYMYTTGFPVVEFVLKTKIELPEQVTVFDNGVHLFKVDTGKDALRNEYVYDGWLRFEDLSERGIQEAIDKIRVTVQGLTFAFEAETTWRLKYSLHSHARGVFTPTKEDMTKTVNLLKSIDNSDDKDRLMAAVSWFNLGTKSENPIVAFVCYYTAVEALARQLSEGKLQASKFYKTKKAALSDKERLAKYDELCRECYPNDIMKLLAKGYFEIHETITQEMRNAFESMYGDGHVVYKTMFGKGGLVGLRGSIVHESYSEWDRKQYDEALKHLHEMHDIAHGFIIRIATHVPRGQKRELMSGKFKFSMDASLPTTMLVGSDLKHLPNDDWKIRHEWV